MRGSALQYFFLLFFSAFCITSCEVINPSEDIPAYIHIDSIPVMDTITNQPFIPGSQRIADAWVYVDGMLQGVYELPATFPVLTEGDHKLTIYGGILVNGIAATRTAYPFFVSHVETRDLQPAVIDTVYPKIRYESNLQIPLNEDYESVGSAFRFASDSKVDTFKKVDNDSLVFEGNFSGEYTLTSSLDYLNIETSNKYTLPNSGIQPIYIEMNYKTDVELLVGIIADNSVKITIIDKMTLFPTETWKKVYIDITSQISSQQNSKFKIFFKAHYNPAIAQSKVTLDNIKIVHR